MAFRGRGRGRGAPPPRHDIQLPEHEQVSDVPVTFPKIPDKHVPIRAKDVQLGAQQQRVLMRFTKMRTWYRRSPFFLDSGTADQVDLAKGSTPNIGKYEDEANVSNAKTSSQPLHEVITMHDKYMPKELFSEKEQKKSLRARKSRPKAAVKQEADVDLMQLQKDGEGEKEEGDEDGEDKDKEAEAQEEEDDDDEFDHEDDDYYQGEHFDDDEEYEDADDGEGEAYF